MSSAPNKKLLPDFESIRNVDEKILWVGRPKSVPYIFSGVMSGILIVLFGAIWILTSYNINSDNAEGGTSQNYFWLFGLIPLVQGVYSFLNKILSYPNTAYAYSDKRVMMRTGFIGADFKVVDYDKISDIEVTVNAIERMYNVGTIKFFSGRTQTDDGNTTKLYDTWIAIENPYEVFKIVKQVAMDIKTDYNYPNSLRPDVNPGYTTNYERIQ